MKNITIDLNIILDFLFKREGHEKAAELLKYCANNKAKGYLCAHEITPWHFPVIIIRKGILKQKYKE
ncbi:hypothetical protein FACS189445_3520 [Spirochaetia bacterium]|nr:hypothetical protein FACS189445_3520 [Spirochaetia bacterium]